MVRVPSVDVTANERPVTHHPRRLASGLAHYADTHNESHRNMQAPRPPPEDNRSLTARICGDPLPGRQAR